jgi:hypothetical protein
LEKLHYQEFHNLNLSPNVIRIIKPGIIRRVGHVERMERRGMLTGFS